MTASVGQTSGAWDSAIHRVSVAGCSCSCLVVKAAEVEARAAAKVHALNHRTRGGVAVLPIKAWLGAWSLEEAA
jgi:hypothetical protein